MTTTPLRVVVIARAVMPLHGVGGLERSVHDLVRHLAERGVGVTLIVPPASVRHQSWTDPFAHPQISVRHVSYLTFPLANRRGTTVVDRSTAYLLYGYRAGRLAHALARDGAADIIHGFGASLLGAAMSPHVVPLVLNPQGLEEFGATATTQTVMKRAGYAPLRWAVRRAARAADCIIATDVALEPTVARHLTPRPGQMETIPNGIDLVALAATAGPAGGAMLRQRSGIDADERVLLSVGRLEFNKGFDVLARALGRASGSPSFAQRPWRWVIVGAGPYRSHIERTAADAGIETRTTFAGRASEADLHAWYEAASVFVHPTRYEGSSLVTLEAMAHRRAVVATNAGGLPDKVRPGVNGWIVAPDDVDALASALEAALADDDRLKAMGAASRSIVEREFSWSVIADRHIAMYRRLLSGTPASTT
ncbi:MAG: glycosyltransferase family 4 protein [Acidobacteriota bacterium]